MAQRSNGTGTSASSLRPWKAILDLRGRIAYRCMKGREGPDYYHLASAVDDQAIKSLQEREFFKRYTAKTKSVAGGTVEVVPLEMIAETKLGA